MTRIKQFFSNLYDDWRTGQIDWQLWTRRLGLGLVLLPILCCCLLFAIAASPIGYCLDFFSGRMPPSAGDRFLTLYIDALQENNQPWLAAVSSADVAQKLTTIDPALTAGPYEIKMIDQLAGYYEYEILFTNGSKISLSLHANWDRCPDFSVKENELTEKIKVEWLYIRPPNQ